MIDNNSVIYNSNMMLAVPSYDSAGHLYSPHIPHQRTGVFKYFPAIQGKFLL